MTQAALIAYSVALLGWSLVKVLAPGFFARQDTRTPMRSAVQSLGVTIALNLLVPGRAWYLGLLREPGLHIVLAATNGVGALFNAWTALPRSAPAEGVRAQPGVARHARSHPRRQSRDGAGALVGWRETSASWLSAGTLERAWRCAVCIGGGMAAYFAPVVRLGHATARPCGATLMPSRQPRPLYLRPFRSGAYEAHPRTSGSAPGHSRLRRHHRRL